MTIDRNFSTFDNFFLIHNLVWVKSAVKVTQSLTFLDFIFLMLVSLGNKKSLDEWTKVAVFTRYGCFFNWCKPGLFIKTA